MLYILRFQIFLETKVGFQLLWRKIPFHPVLVPSFLLEKNCVPLSVFTSLISTLYSRASDCASLNVSILCSAVALSNSHIIRSIVKRFSVVLCQSPWSKLPECSLSYLHLASKRFGLVLPSSPSCNVIYLCHCFCVLVLLCNLIDYIFDLFVVEFSHAKS